MFERARLKLAAWYLLIIMLISVAFSLAIYQVLSQELTRVERAQRLRQQRIFIIPFDQQQPRIPAIDPEVIEESKHRLLAILFLINIAILLTSSGAGYFLAGRTLNPIREMIDEQTRFITDASHELRTPLTSLKSEIEVNLRDPKLNLKEAKNLLQSNLEEVNNLQYLSDNLIKLTKYNDKNLTQFEKINLVEVVNESQKKVLKLSKIKNITIKNNIKNSIILGDKQSLIELFVIFLDNAIKYSDKNKTITLDSKKADNFIEIGINDQGFGIEQKDIPHLFDRFYRADKSRTKSQIPGYGLGLSIAKQIIDKHHGIVKVESEISKGTTFYIKLPLA